MMKKSQLTGQVFVYIVAVIVVGLIFLLGYKYMGTILETKCEAEEVAFLTDMESYADKYDGYNEVENKAMNAPCGYTKVCFVDVDAIKNGTTITNAPPSIKLSVQEKVEQNIFLIGDEKEKSSYSEKIKVENSFLCINKTAGYFHIRFRGDSTYTLVESYEP